MARVTAPEQSALAAGQEVSGGDDLSTSSARTARDSSIRGHHRDLAWIFGLPDAIDEPIVCRDRKDAMKPRRLGRDSGVVRAVEDDPDLGVSVEAGHPLQ
jgi:hypothetical protein